MEIDANTEVPLHTHPHEQAGIVIEGEMEMGVAGEVQMLQPGDMYIIPGGVEHAVVTGPERALALDIFHPIREEYKP